MPPLHSPLSTLLLAVLCLTVGYIWGVTYPTSHRAIHIIPTSSSSSSSSTPSTVEDTGPDLPLVSSLFTYNATFGQRPSPSTNAAWSSLFPHQAGFFRHPVLSPDRATFSAFHQLHCLDGLRQGYWALYDALASLAMDGEEEGQKKKVVNVEDDLPMMASPSHVRHCIDLLRRALMCQPDLTVEVKDEKLGGVRGFGTVHVCRDWNELVRWTSTWEEYGQRESDGLGVPSDKEGRVHGVTKEGGKHDEQR